jgi:hypothetical protein
MSMETVPAYVEAVDDPDSPGGAGRVDAALTFRLGLADTVYRQHGELHVLAGLALRALNGFDVEGAVTVGTVTTRFTVAGRSAEVFRALDALTAWMRAPSWEAVDDVVAAVRRDGAGGLEGTDDELRLAALARWGRDGVGLLGCSPHCGYAAGVDRLDRWRTRFLTAGNGVLSGAGGEMGDLVLQLPTGTRVPAPEDRSPIVPLPGWRRAPGLGPVPLLTAATKDAATTRALSALLTRELNDQPAVGRGRPASRTRALPVGTGLFWLYTHRAGTTSRLLTALDRVADDELRREDLDAVTSAATTGPSALARADGAAMAALLGTPVPRPVAEVTADEVAAEAGRVRVSLLLLTEDSVPEDAGLSEVTPAPPHAGTVLHRYHGARSRDELVITEHTCEVRSDRREERVAWDEVVGVHRAEHDVRRLVPRDGPELWVDAHEWRHGRHALGMIDGHVADDLVIHEPDPDDLLPYGAGLWRQPSVLALVLAGVVTLLALVLLGVWIAT